MKTLKLLFSATANPDLRLPFKLSLKNYFSTLPAGLPADSNESFAAAAKTLREKFA